MTKRQKRRPRQATGFAALIATAMLLVAAAPTSRAEPARTYQTVASADGTPLAIMSQGPSDAPVILFVHGIGQSSLSWSAQFESGLGRSYRLVAFDLRGHGASGKPWLDGSYSEARSIEDLSAVLTAIGPRRPVVVAWSYGSYVVSDYVRAKGVSAFAGIVFVGATAGMAPQPLDATMAERIAAFRKSQQAQASPDLAVQIEAARETSKRLFFAPVDDAIRQRSFEASLMLPAYARTQLTARRFDSQDLEAHVRTLPLLFLGGRTDNVYAGDTPERLGRLLPRAEIQLYDGVGHSPFLEAPDRFNADLERFVERAFGKTSALAPQR